MWETPTPEAIKNKSLTCMNKIEIGMFNCELFDQCSMIVVFKRSYWQSICTVITPCRITAKTLRYNGNIKITY